MAENNYHTIKWRILMYLIVWFVTGLFFISSGVPIEMDITETILTTTIALIFLLPPFFIVPLYLVPKLLYQRRFVAFVVMLIVSVIASILIYMIGSRVGYHIVDPQFPILPEAEEWILLIHLGLWHNILTMGAALGIRIIFDKEVTENNIRLIETEQREAELQYLRTQLNPLFLITMMGLLKKHVIEEPPATKEFVDTLDTVLRYQINECNQDYISLQAELNYLLSYINVQKTRLEDESIINVQIIGDVPDCRIVPLLIMPLIENAFKHLSHFRDHHENRIELLFEMQGIDTLYVSVYNTYDETELSRRRKNSSGVGLTNLMRRLEILYPGKAILKIEKGINWYHTTLHLPVYHNQIA